MARLEIQDGAADPTRPFRVAKGSDGALHVKLVGEGAIAADGALIDLSGAMTIAYNGDNTIQYIEVEQDGTTYRQTFSYTSGNLTGLSEWEAQP